MNSDRTTLRLLLVEDSEAEAALLLRELRRGGFEVHHQRVETRENLLAALKGDRWDIIVSDYEMPQFSGPEALALCKKHFPDLPCIIVTGHVGEELAVDTMRAGADDYLLKDNLIRLVPTVRRALKEADIWREKRLSEQALQESEEKYRDLVENLNDIIFTMSPDGIITYVSPVVESVVQYKPDEVVHRPFSDFVFHEDLPAAMKAFAEIKAGKIASSEQRIMTKSGELRWMVSSSRPAYDKNGQLTGILNRLTDITDRKRAEAQKDLLVQADKLAVLGTMVSGVAHEINNPNNFIMLNAPILADIWDGILPILEERYKTQGDFIAGGLNYSEIREEVPKLFYGIKEGAERIKRIVGDLKRFARLEPPDLSQDVDINEVVKSAVSLTNDLLKKATDRFTVEYADNPPKIKGNFQRIEQVVINLLLNACEALTGKNQAITVTTSRMAENVVILVSDEGAGIPEDVLRHMTDPFFTTKKDSGGTGLGLSVASGIVKAHGGSLEFTSTLGKGTAAVVILPIRQGTNS